MRPRLSITPFSRRTLLTIHVIVSVGLLGDCAAVVATNIRAATTDDPSVAAASYELLSMFSLLFGIPLSIASLLSGLALGLTSKWGVVRYRWVTAKLIVIVSVMVVGGVLIGPATGALADGRDASTTLLIAASAYDVAVLMLATVLSVFKPGRARQRARLAA